jgi:hypothetical protein
MAEETGKKPQLRAVETPPDAVDFDSLWEDQKLGDGIVDSHFHTVPIGRPKDFFRTHPNRDYRRRCEIYTHKVEGVIGETEYLLAPSMKGRIPEARPCSLVAVMYRDGTPRLWPLKFARDGENDNDAWRAQRAAAKTGITKWVKLLWVSRAYMTRDAPEGYAPDPDWSKLGSFNDLVKAAFGENGVIQDTDHPIYRELFGTSKRPAAGEEDEL